MGNSQEEWLPSLAECPSRHGKGALLPGGFSTGPANLKNQGFREGINLTRKSSLICQEDFVLSLILLSKMPEGQEDRQPETQDKVSAKSKRLTKP